MQFDMAAHALKNFALFAHFDYQIVLRSAIDEPGVAIFRHTVERLRVRLQEALFVTGGQCGSGLLRAELEKMRFEILPTDGQRKIS